MKHVAPFWGEARGSIGGEARGSTWVGARGSDYKKHFIPLANMHLTPLRLARDSANSIIPLMRLNGFSSDEAQSGFRHTSVISSGSSKQFYSGSAVKIAE